MPIALGVAIAWMTVAFATSRLVRRNAVVDVFWGSGFVVLYVASLLISHAMSSSEGSRAWWSGSSFSTTARYGVLVVVAAWGVRLTVHLIVRQRGRGEDSRYVMIMRRAGERNQTLYAFCAIYMLQAALMWFISIPLQWIAFAPTFNSLVLWTGVVTVAAGTIFETVADAQLSRFVADPANQHTTMNRGLWRYSRHPNYFGDAVVWWGIYVAAAATTWGLLTFASPLVMTILLTRVSGKPLLEAKLSRTRSGYAEYVAATSGFVPRPPRTRSSR